MSITDQEGGLWRPANATEGHDFEHKWCRHCANRNGAGDWEDEFGNELEGTCPIAEAMFWSPKFLPDELVTRHGQPWCLAFRQDPAVPARCIFTEEMPFATTSQT